MIAVRLMGGLGNQMFQYALGRTLADLHGVQLLLDTSRFSSQPAREVPRRYELHCFPIRAEVTDRPVPASRWRVRGFLDERVFRLVRESGFRFQPRVLRSPDQTLLFGYWQSERYFKANERVIRRDLAPRVPITERTRRLAQQIGSNTVCIQVRRGDFVSHPASSAFHGVLSLEYYRAALEHIIGVNGASPDLLVVSDDPQWCSEHLELGYPMTVAPPMRANEWEDMMLMALCRSTVIANSSFGWWGAWLSPHPDKVVVAPRKWFRNESADTRDLIPPGWVRL